MKKILLLAFALCSFGAAAQNSIPHYRVYDFSEIDLKEIDTRKLSRQLDSIYFNSGYDSIVQLLAHIRSREERMSYVSFFIGYQATFASLDQLNEGLALAGFSQMSETFHGVPWGVDIKGERFLFTYLLVPGIRQTAENTSHTVEVNGISMQLAIGYDVINHKRIQLYPQVALSLQDFDIQVKRRNAPADLYTIDDMLMNPAGTRLEKSSFELVYGAELDYHLVYRPNSAGIIVGLRYGRSLAIADGNFKLHDKTSVYRSSDRIAESLFSAVVKFYLRN